MRPEPEEYDGERSEEAFVKFLNEKCGTQRAVGGGLNDEVRIFSTRNFHLDSTTDFHIHLLEKHSFV